MLLSKGYGLRALILILVNKKKRGAERPVYMISATMVIVQPCDYFFRSKSQLVRYPNCETIGNNDKQLCVIVSATNEETPYEQFLYYCFFPFNCA